MKRHLIRFVALGLVVGLGYFGITQMMKSSEPTDSNNNTVAAAKNPSSNSPTTVTPTYDQLQPPSRISNANYQESQPPQTKLVGNSTTPENKANRYGEQSPPQPELASNNAPVENRTYKTPVEITQPRQIEQPTLQKNPQIPNQVNMEITVNKEDLTNQPRTAAPLELPANTGAKPMPNQPQSVNQPQPVNQVQYNDSRYGTNNNNQPTPSYANEPVPVPNKSAYSNNNNDNQFQPAPRNLNPAANNTSTNLDTANAIKATPGAKSLEGTQAPSLSLEKTAPKEIQVGRPALFEIEVRNTGKVDAHSVRVLDAVPKGTTLISTTPQASVTANNGIIWQLGTLKAGDSKRLKVELMPRTEGEIGSVASVTFRTEASVRTVATRPRLTMEVISPAKVMIGQQVEFEITVSNPGSGVASSVTIENNVPQGLKHAGGSEIEYEIGDLKPGEKRTIKLSLTATAAGQVINPMLARAEGNLKVEKKVNLEVIAPGLKVAINGPRLRYLERKATYKLSIHNPGTAAAKEVELVTFLPKGMKFVKASNSGEYDKAQHAVYWSLAELPSEKSGKVTLTTIPTLAGNQTLRVEGSAEKGLKHKQEKEVVVEGLVALSFEVLDVHDPVEVGGEVVYEVRVVNRGTKTASNIRVDALMPMELKAISGKGPTTATTTDRKVTFASLSRLAPKADTTFTVRAKAEKAGDLRINVQVLCDEMPQPVVRQESTRVFADQ